MFGSLLVEELRVVSCSWLDCVMGVLLSAGTILADGLSLFVVELGLD